jgi:ABC-type phosphate transport system substrate-binding protein
MISTRPRLAAALAVAATSMATLAAVAPAQAADPNPNDPTFVPSATDLVGVGSDTTQIVMHYLAEGVNGTPGWNAQPGNTTKRVASWAADGAPATISLRQGSAAITRPNGSTAGKNLLYAPGDNADVSFARSSSAVSTTESNAGLRAFPFAVDGLKLAARDAGTNAPATLTEQQVLDIYTGKITNWSDVGGSAGTIVPLIPQAGSGTRSYFESQLQRINNGTKATLGTNVQETQEHSDEKIKNDPNAVAPFSTARAKGTSTVELLGGFGVERAVYNVVRLADLSNATKGATLRALFGSDGFVCSATGRTLIEAAGFEQLATPSRGGACGQLVTNSTANLLTAGEATNGISGTGTATPDGTVRLSASVNPVDAEGTVVFKEGGTTVGTAEVNTNGTATVTLSDVAEGAHTYDAVFTPTDTGSYTTATASISVEVPDEKYETNLSVASPSTAFGADRTVTVTVAKQAVDATGTVTYVYGDAPARTATLAGGKATFVVPADLAAGSYWGAVRYSGDANYAAQVALSKLTVTKAATTSKLTISPTKVKLRKTTKGTVTVAITGSTLKAAGTVTLKIGSTVVGSGKVVAGKAVVTIKAQTKTGKKSVKAYFTPSGGSYGASTSGTATFTVVK